jgi:trehalose-phosphatase
MEGKKVFEIRPNEDVNKGTVALRLMRELANDGAAVVYLGDDATDEDAFASLRASAPAAVTARVTNDDGTRTAAEFSLEDTNAVTRFLKWLAAQRGIRAPNGP